MIMVYEKLAEGFNIAKNADFIYTISKIYDRRMIDCYGNRYKFEKKDRYTKVVLEVKGFKTLKEAKSIQGG